MGNVIDLRLIIGLFFLIVGIMLVGASFVQQTEGYRINRDCGSVFVLFGGVMLILYRKYKGKV